MSTQLDQSHHVLIVGATKGIGFALASQLAEQRVRITLSGCTAEHVEQALTRLRAHDPTAQPQGIVLDLRDHAAVRRVFTGVGPIDALALCGSSDIAWGSFASLSMEAVERALHMKLTGYLNAVQAAVPQLAERGSITFVGGAASRAALPGTVGLAAVNGALEAATRTLARELAPRRVNLVSPGLTDTEAYDTLPAQTKAAQFAAVAARLPVGRTGLPDDISHAIRFVMNNPFVTGTIVDVDGGAHLG
ncbi:MAG: SDR family oxidoreductase [Steroidobacteraceae bacterium]|jgi:NAD(P)-dependent dehydrogenase (short-subunit alcohol dehydrogenase family)